MDDCEQLLNETLDALEGMINAVKDAAPHFLYTATLLRRRRDCEGSKSFDKGIRALNGILTKHIPLYQKLKERANDKDNSVS